MNNWCGSESLKNSENTRPLPGPLPQGEGEVSRASWKLEWRGRNRCFFAIQYEKRSRISDDHFTSSRRMIPPLLGERAGVRADVNTNLKEVFS